MTMRFRGGGSGQSSLLDQDMHDVSSSVVMARPKYLDYRYPKRVANRKEPN